MQPEEIHCSNLACDTVFARYCRRVWKAHNHIHPIPECSFEGSIRAALRNLYKRSDGILRAVDRFGNNLTERMDVEMAPSLGETQRFIVPVRCEGISKADIHVARRPNKTYSHPPGV
jgi:hypothetical protein